MTYPYAPRVKPEVQQAIVDRLLAGEGTEKIGEAFNRSGAWIWLVANASGIKYDRKAKQWNRVEQETTDVTEQQWNLTNEEYEAILTPEREQANTNGHAAATEDHTSLDDDIQEALDLLGKAEQQRKADIKIIEQLQRQLADADRITANISDKVDHLRNEKRELETRVLQLETENKRLMDKLKGEISRGLLRQSMDNLRKVL